MPFTSNLINIAKSVEHSSVIRGKATKAARTAVFGEFKKGLETIKTTSFNKVAGYAPLKTEATEAAEALAKLHPPLAADVFERAAKRNQVAQKALQDFEKANVGNDADLIALSRLKIKRKLSLNGTGKEYARIKSTPKLGEKHPVVKVKLPARGDQPVAEYVTNTHISAKDYIAALETRSPFVSPRLARQGKDIKASVAQYNDATAAFNRICLNGDTEPFAQVLAEQPMPVKVLQNGKFRIQVQDRSDVGRLSAKLNLGKQTMAEHIRAGLEKARRLHNALEKDNVSAHLSNKLVRNNFVQKQVDFRALEHLEAAKATLNDQYKRIQKLERKGVFVKVLRDKTFRIIVQNSEGVVAKTRHIRFTKHTDMATHIENGLKQAKLLSKQELPEEIATKQKLKNKFSPFKNKVLQFIG